MLSFSFQILSFYPGACRCPRIGRKEILLLTRGRAVQNDHCTARLCHLLQKSTAGVGKKSCDSLQDAAKKERENVNNG